MKCRNRPLYPQCGCDCQRPCNECGQESWRMPLFDHDPAPPQDCSCAKTVRLENPCRPGEWAEVTLNIDLCGNLVVCIHKNGRHHPHPCHRC